MYTNPTIANITMMIPHTLISLSVSVVKSMMAVRNMPPKVSFAKSRRNFPNSMATSSFSLTGDGAGGSNCLLMVGFGLAFCLLAVMAVSV